MTGPVMMVEAVSATHPGRVRPNNEDAVLVAPPVFLVADGMGGHAQGERASATAAEVFAGLQGREWVSHDLVAQTVAAAARRVDALAEGYRAPGTTVAGVALSVFEGMPCWRAFNIGDSRVYLLRDRTLRQISLDHTAEREGIAASPHAITRALGAGVPGPVADQWLIKAYPGDRVLLCTDGLSRELDHCQLRACLMGIADQESVARALIKSALREGGHDNVSLVVVDCLDVRDHTVADPNPEISDQDEQTTVVWSISDGGH